MTEGKFPLIFPFKFTEFLERFVKFVDIMDSLRMANTVDSLGFSNVEDTIRFTEVKI